MAIVILKHELLFLSILKQREPHECAALFVMPGALQTVDLRELVPEIGGVAGGVLRPGGQIPGRPAPPDRGPLRQDPPEDAADLADLLIVSQVRVEVGAEQAVAVRPANGAKCLRCWKVLPTVGSDAQHPELCPRCAAVCKALNVVFE